MSTRKGIWNERSKTWIRPSGTVKQGRRPMFKPFQYQVGGKRGPKFDTLKEAIGYEKEQRTRDGIFRAVEVKQ